MTFKKIVLYTLVLGLAICPQLVYGRTANEPTKLQKVTNRTTSTKSVQKPADRKVVENNFCSSLSNFTTRVNQGIASKEKALTEKKDGRRDKLSSSKSEAGQKLSDHRETQDQKIDDLFTKLILRAKTDEQKKAVETFRSTIESATNTRRAAVDAANLAFQSGLETAVSGRKVEIETAKTSFETEVKQAQDTAKSDCLTGVEAATVKQTLKASLETARQKLVTDIKSADKVREGLTDLKTAHKESIEKAVSQYRETLQKALTDLKTAFKTAKTDSAAEEK